MQERSIVVFLDPEPCCVNVVVMSQILLLSGWPAEYLSETMDDFFVDFLMLATVDTDFAWLSFLSARFPQCFTNAYAFACSHDLQNEGVG